MITKTDIENLALLARVKLSPQEIEGLQHDFSSILAYIDQIQAVAPENTQPSVPLLRNVMREDTPRIEGSMLSGKEEALRSAFPVRKGDSNSVRKIIQKDE